MCQYLAACVSNPEPDLPLPVRQQDSSHHSLYLSPPGTPHSRSHKARRSCPEATPTAAVILQLMEMGFRRKKIEFAIRALGELDSLTIMQQEYVICTVFALISVHPCFSVNPDCMVVCPKFVCHSNPYFIILQLALDHCRSVFALN